MGSIWARTSTGSCWQSDLPSETNRAMTFFKSAIDQAVETAWMYNCDRQVGPCLQIFACEIEDRRVCTMGVDEVTMTGKIRQDGLCSHDSFAQVPLHIRKCPHDIDVNVKVKTTMKGISEDYEGQRIQLPVSHNNEPVIIQATLFNVGAKKVTMSTDNSDDFPSSETQVVSMTAFADEIGTDIWSAILQSPVKHILKVLLPDDPDFSFLATPWGRAFQCNGKRCEPKQATSVQFHVRLQKADLRTILTASGVAGVYTTPKSEDRQLSLTIRWCGCSRQRLN